MALRAVRQQNGTGCFIAAVATILGKTYEEAFRLCHPGKDPLVEWEHGFTDTSMMRVALQVLERVGIKGRPASFKRFSSYRKRDKHALLIIRWKWDPTRCHTVVYDGEAHVFYDPSHGGELHKWQVKDWEKQLDCAIFVEAPPIHEVKPEAPSDIPRSADAHW
jgi:hypothetical protein